MTYKMDFVFKKYGKYKIFKIKKNTLDFKLTKQILKIANGKNCVVDCKDIKDFSDFQTLDLILKNNIVLCNAAYWLMQQASLLCRENFPKFYICEEDFFNNKRMLVRRRFRVV